MNDLRDHVGLKALDDVLAKRQRLGIGSDTLPGVAATGEVD